MEIHSPRIRLWKIDFRHRVFANFRFIGTKQSNLFDDYVKKGIIE